MTELLCQTNLADDVLFNYIAVEAGSVVGVGLRLSQFVFKNWLHKQYC